LSEKVCSFWFEYLEPCKSNHFKLCWLVPCDLSYQCPLASNGSEAFLDPSVHFQSILAYVSAQPEGRLPWRHEASPLHFAPHRWAGGWGLKRTRESSLRKPCILEQMHSTRIPLGAWVSEFRSLLQVSLSKQNLFHYDLNYSAYCCCLPCLQPLQIEETEVIKLELSGVTINSFAKWARDTISKQKRSTDCCYDCHKLQVPYTSKAW